MEDLTKPIDSGDVVCRQCGISPTASFEACPQVPEQFNYQPSEDHLKVLNSHVTDALNKIEELTSAIKRLEDNRSRLQTYVQRQKSFFSPINNVSDDILLLIFHLHYLDEVPPQSGHYSDNIWGISAVCQRWRSLSLSCPTLWTGLEYAEQKAEESRRSLYRMKLQLERTSPMHLLHLDFYGKLAYFGGLLTQGHPNPSTQPALDLIVANAQRFESIDFEGPLHRGCTLPPTSPDFCNLKQLIVNYRNENEPLRDSWFRDNILFSRTTHLETLSLSSIDQVDGPMELGWGSLTVLQLRQVDVMATTLLEIFTLTHNLEKLTIIGCSHTHGPSPRATHHVVLPKLRIMHVHFWMGAKRGFDNQLEEAEVPSNMHVATALGHLRTPVLNELELGYLQPLHFQHLQRFLRGCTSQLASMRLHQLEGLATPWPLLMPMLEAAPAGLRSLSLAGGRWQFLSADPLSHALAVSSSTPGLFPVLEELIIEGFQAEPTALKQMVESRLRAEHALESTFRSLTLTTMHWTGAERRRISDPEAVDAMLRGWIEEMEDKYDKFCCSLRSYRHGWSDI